MERTTCLYLDANVLIRAFEGADDVAEELLTLLAAETRQCELATSELTLAEVLVGAIRAGNRQLTDTYENWLAPGGDVGIGPVTRDALVLAATLRAEHATLKLPDAIHISMAVSMGCSHFLTFDKRLEGPYQFRNRRHGGVERSEAVSILQLDLGVLRLLNKGVRP